MSEVKELNIEDILDEWKNDCKIDKTHVIDEITRTPILHSKYLTYYQQFKFKVLSLEKAYRKMEILRKKYYRGESTREELTMFGWPQYQGKAIQSVTGMKERLESDEPLVAITEKIEKATTGVKAMEYILKAISERGFAMKNIVEYVKFENGA